MAHDRGVAHSVTFLGGVGEPERILSCLDLFAITSDTEQMPLSVLEAMSSGHAVVGTHVGDVHDMVAPENRRFIVASDPAALAEAAVALLDDHGLRRSTGEANRRRAHAEFDEGRMVAAYDRLFAGRISAAMRSAPLVPEPFPSAPV
jgi:glycosyltransferase involved in cell wall biosynthesis